MILITPSTMEDLRDYFAELPDYGRLFIEGESPMDVAVYKIEKDENRVSIWVRIPSGVRTVTKIQIIKKDGEVMLERNAPITKPEPRNVYTRFEFELEEVPAP